MAYFDSSYQAWRHDANPPGVVRAHSAPCLPTAWAAIGVSTHSDGFHDHHQHPHQGTHCRHRRGARLYPHRGAAGQHRLLHGARQGIRLRLPDQRFHLLRGLPQILHHAFHALWGRPRHPDGTLQTERDDLLPVRPTPPGFPSAARRGPCHAALEWRCPDPLRPGWRLCRLRPGPSP